MQFDCLVFVMHIKMYLHRTSKQRPELWAYIHQAFVHFTTCFHSWLIAQSHLVKCHIGYAVLVVTVLNVVMQLLQLQYVQNDLRNVCLSCTSWVAKLE
jgi:hypothetical protein